MVNAVCRPSSAFGAQGSLDSAVGEADANETEGGNTECFFLFLSIEEEPEEVDEVFVVSFLSFNRCFSFSFSVLRFSDFLSSITSPEAPKPVKNPFRSCRGLTLPLLTNSPNFPPLALSLGRTVKGTARDRGVEASWEGTVGAPG